MFDWEDREYVNPRKRIMKDVETGKIYTFEIQDDPDNIAQESETPITAHNLNMAQQELVDDMSKTYTGTNITANTIEGIGRINKVYGKTTEEGTGDKSPSNPYTLKCVGDDINLFNATLESGTIGATGINTDNNMRVRTADYITLDKGTYTISYSGANYVGVQQYDTNNNNICTLVSWTAGTATFNVTEKCKVRFIFKINDSTVMTVNSVTKIKLQKGTVATAYSPYGYGTVEDISKNGSNSSSNIVYVDKPLCSIGDVRDELSYKRKITRRCGEVVLNGTENWIMTETVGDIARFVSYNNNIKAASHFMCNKLKVITQTTEAVTEECITERSISQDNAISIIIKTSRLSSIDANGFKSFLASNNIRLIYELATPAVESIDCSDKIVQYDGQTNIYNRDRGEIEVSFTNNKAIAEVNENLKCLEKPVIISKTYTLSCGIEVTFIKINKLIQLNIGGTVASMPAGTYSTSIDTEFEPSTFYRNNIVLAEGSKFAYLFIENRILSIRTQIDMTTIYPRASCMYIAKD